MTTHLLSLRAVSHRLLRARTLPLVGAMLIVFAIVVGWIDQATGGLSVAEGLALGFVV